MIIGREIKTDKEIEIDIDRSRVILITGKRGSGKSYTLGVITEELFTSVPSSQSKILILLIDPLGIFWTFCLSNEDKEASLPVLILTPGNPIARYGRDVVERKMELGVELRPIRINPSSISPSGWCDLFDLSINEPLGIALFRAVQNLTREYPFFSIDDMIEAVTEDHRAQDKTKEALINRLEMAKGWDIFSTSHEELQDKLSSDHINVLDLSTLDPGSYGLANLILSVICRELFVKRVKAKHKENLGLAHQREKIWLLIDEAQRFAPSGRSTFSKEILISWVKEGRQPGLSAVFTTQQPSSLDNDILSQCDLIICHRLSNKEDITALNRLSQDYLTSELKTYIRLVRNQGEALVLDDLSEKLSIVRVKRRKTLHGGDENLWL